MSKFFFDTTHCTLCPRACGADRTAGTGVCGADEHMRIAKAMLHFYEEPPVSGTRGSGAIFFRGCALRCGYCQNADISRDATTGEVVRPNELAETMVRLQDAGAHNINLVTAGHYLPQVAEALDIARRHLHIPVVYNSSGYERVEALRLLDGLVDVYLPDFKYADGAAAARYSRAADYPAVATAAIREMVRQTGEYTEKDGIAVRGTIVRHLVLPGLSRDGVQVMRIVAREFPLVRVSIMRQYTPAFNRTGDPALDRKVTTMEYNRVLTAAQEAGLRGFMQGADAATSAYTPDFTADTDFPK